MAQFYTSHFHNGWYDTQFCMRTVVQHPYLYHPSPFPILPYSSWIDTPQLYEQPPPTYTPKSPKSDPPPTPPTPNPAPALPTKPPLRSILKRSPAETQTRRKKSVHFPPSTLSSPLPQPGIYKHLGKPRPPRSCHPARFHPCLAGMRPQAVVSAAPPHQQPMRQLPNSSSRVQPLPVDHSVARPPTWAPAAVFQGVQSPGQRQHQHPNTSAPRRPIPAVAPPAEAKRTAAKVQVPVRKGLKKGSQTRPQMQVPIPANTGPYGSDSEDSNTDVRLAKRVTGRKAKVVSLSQDAKTEATRRSLRALAREFDRKNMWRRGAGVG